jgi:hypothetical protein
VWFELAFPTVGVFSEREDIQNHPGNARGLDEKKLNGALAEEWKKRCRSPMRTESVSPTWLIDVREGCLVPGYPCGNVGGYACLSYRW